MNEILTIEEINAAPSLDLDAFAGLRLRRYLMA